MDRIIKYVKNHKGEQIVVNNVKRTIVGYCDTRRFASEVWIIVSSKEVGWRQSHLNPQDDRLLVTLEEDDLLLYVNYRQVFPDLSLINEEKESHHWY